MTYNETLNWMFAQLPMYQQKGQTALNNKLDTILSFSAYLENPHNKFKSIHVAGTNGKGSSCHMLSSVLQEAGYTVGLYTSPHLKDFRERVKINGEMAPKRFVSSFIKKHKSYLEQNQLSFFEMTVGMAFYYFAKKKVDIAIIEVGLGGRLDSTNIITPEVSLITNIGRDHMHILGDTLEKIANEKAGIIKKNTPVVISERQQETEKVFIEVADSQKAKILFAQDSFKSNYNTDLLGDYQKRNCLGVVATLKQLKDFTISENHIKLGLQQVVQNTGLLGRWQWLQRKPKIVCDTAHNPEGLKLVMQQIQKHNFKTLHMVIGLVADKNIDEVLPCFPERASYYFVKPNIIRGLDAEKLKKKALGFGLKGKAYTSVKTGLKAAMKMSKEEDFVFVGGSTFVVAEVV